MQGLFSGAWCVRSATLLVCATLVLLLTHCTGSSTSAATAEEGLIVYREAGCAACHGQTGLGGSGPALGGHNTEKVARQVRAPFGAMSMYNQQKLGDDDLAAIVMFIDGLEPVDHSDRWGTGLDPRDALAAHHWLALIALRNGDDAEAVHQIEHTYEHIGGEHLAAMRDIAGLIERGETAEADTRLADMSAGSEPEPALIELLNLEIATTALAASDPAEATRHMPWDGG